MKIRIIIVIGISLLVITIGIIGLLKYNKYNDFNFIIQYGVGASNCLNTFDDTYIKNLNSRIEKRHMELTEQEIKQILNKMLIIDIFNYPSTFPKRMTITTNERVNLEIEYKGKVKIIEFTSENWPLASIDVENNTVTYLEFEKDKDVIEFIKLKEYIIEIIERHDED